MGTWQSVIDSIVYVMAFPTSLHGKAGRRLLRDASFVSLPRLIEISALERPQYAYCMYYGALLARRLGVATISAIEFGVAGGNGILAMERLANRIEAETGVTFEIYGFDTGEGLPQTDSRYDLPYWFQPRYYKMDALLLKDKMQKAKIILGDVKRTSTSFFYDHSPAPIACIFNDLDYYSSTINSFEIFNGDDNYFLPRCFCYFDDVIGTPWEMYGNESGELLAIKKFNESNINRKILKNCNLASNARFPWHHQIYYYHNFEHPSYHTYIGGYEQEAICSALKLKQ